MPLPGLGRVGPSGPGLGWPGGRRSAALCPQDAFQEEYSRTGTFPETPMVPPRRPWTLVNWLFWASMLLYPFFRFVVNMVSSGSSLTLASFVLVFFVGESRLLGAGAGAGWEPLGAGEDEALEEGNTPIGVLNPGAGGLPRPLPVCAWGPVRTGSQPLQG